MVRACYQEPYAQERCLAISDQETNVRMYPALNMDETVLREGLAAMEEAIAHIDRHGQDLGDSPDLPTGS